MNAISGGDLTLIAPITIKNILRFHYTIQKNAHGICALEVVLSQSEAEKLEGIKDEIKLQIIASGETKEDFAGCVFYGLLHSYSIKKENGLHTAWLTLITASSKLDRQTKSRAFQNKELTYAEIAKDIIKNNEKASVICNKETCVRINEPAIQYAESNWAFLKRLASRCGHVLYSEYLTGNPNFWFGIRMGTLIEEPQEYSKAGIGRGYYTQNQAQSNSLKGRLAKDQYLYYTFNSSQSYEIGDQVKLREERAVIYEKTCTLIHGQLQFQYQAGRKGSYHQKQSYQEALTGLTLEGTIQKTREEKGTILFDIDKETMPIDWEWDFTPNTGSQLYTMPEAGSKARHRFHSQREKEGTLVGAVREASPGQEASKRAYQTAKGKALQIQEDHITICGDGGTITLREEESLTLSSGSKLEMTARDGILLESSQIEIISPQEINLYQSPSKGEEKNNSIMPKGTKSNPPTGEGSFTLNNEFNAKAKTSVINSIETIAYTPYKDDPEKGTDIIGTLALEFKSIESVLYLAGGNLYKAVATKTGIGNKLAEYYLNCSVLTARGEGINKVSRELTIGATTDRLSLSLEEILSGMVKAGVFGQEELNEMKKASMLKVVDAYWDQTNGYFSGNWWQDEKKIEKAYEYLQKETSYRNLTLLDLANRFQYGEIDNRICALQELVGVKKTGVYEADTAVALKSVLLSQGMEDFDTYNPALDEKTLATIKQWYDNSSEAGRKVIYFLENGGEDIIYGMGTIAIGAAMGKNARDYAKEEHPDKYDERYEQQGSESKGEGGANKGVGNPVKVEGRGSTGRVSSNNLNEQMAMHEVQSNPLQGSSEVPITMTDPRWTASEGWVKMQKVITTTDGSKITIHFDYNKVTGAFDDFKYK